MLKAPSNFRFDIYATELFAAAATIRGERGLPALVWSRGMTKEDANHLREALVERVAKVDAIWNKHGAVVFSISVEPGKTEAGGFDVRFLVEEGKRLQVAQTITPAG